MSTFESSRRMTYREQTAYDMGYQAGKHDAVVHGEWIDKPTGRYCHIGSYCSVCGKKSGIGGIESNRHKPYCPNCGATMDGKVLPHKFLGKSQDGECGVEILDGKGGKDTNVPTNEKGDLTAAKAIKNLHDVLEKEAMRNDTNGSMANH